MILVYGIIKEGKLIVSKDREYEEFIFKNEGKKVAMRIEKETGIRTSAQNNALHKYFELLADALNGAGYTIKKVLEHMVDLDWNTNLIKEVLWRPVQIALTGKTSTTALDKVNDINTTYEHVNRYVSEKFYIHVPFPQDESKKEVAEVIINYPENKLTPKF